MGEAFASGRPRLTARVFTIANRKGGTGKTSTAVNLSAELAASGRKVLLVDLDSQGHAGFGVGVLAKPGETSAHEMFRTGARHVATGIHKSAIDLIDCLPADRSFDGIVTNQNPRCLAQALRPVVAYYDFIVIDTPPTSDPILVNALVASDQVIVPTLLHHLSFEGVEQFAKSFFWIATGLSRNLRAMLILPNQIDLRVTMQRDVMAKLLRIYGDANVLDGIRVDVAVAEAFGARLPVRHHRPHSKAAEDFARLAHRMSLHLAEPIEGQGDV